MTVEHGQWSDEDLAEVTSSGDEAAFAMGESTLENYAAKLPEDANALGMESGVNGARQAGESGNKQDDGNHSEKGKAASAKSPELPPEFKKKLDAMKQALTVSVPRFLFHLLAVKQQNPELELNDEEAKQLSGALDFAMAGFGLDFQFEPMLIPIQSPFWLLLWPILVGLLLFIKKGMPHNAEFDNSNRGPEGKGQNLPNVQ